jgi:hypothetical protein
LKQVAMTLSAQFGHAHVFTTQMQMDWYGWLLADRGQISRCFVHGGATPTVNEGQSSKAEVESRQAHQLSDEAHEPWEESIFGEEVVMDIAREVSVAPEDFSADLTGIGQGVLAITSWGRKFAVPSRSLDEESV